MKITNELRAELEKVAKDNNMSYEQLRELFFREQEEIFNRQDIEYFIQNNIWLELEETKNAPKYRDCADIPIIEEAVDIIKQQYKGAEADLGWYDMLQCIWDCGTVDNWKQTNGEKIIEIYKQYFKNLSEQNDSTN